MVSETVRKEEASKLSELFEMKKEASRVNKNRPTFTQQTIADLGRWTQPNVSAYLRGSVALKDESALVFAEALGVPVSAFSPRLAEVIKQRNILARNPLLGKNNISYVPKLSFSALSEIRHKLKDENFIMPMSEESTPTTNKLSHQSFSIDLRDHSLEPKFSIGTTFTFDPSLSPKPTNIVIAGNRDKPDDFHIRFYKVVEILEDGTEVYELEAKNTAYPTLKTNYEILGVAVSVTTNLL